jgi:hypothetical protein
MAAKLPQIILGLQKIRLFIERLAALCGLAMICEPNPHSKDQ